MKSVPLPNARILLVDDNRDGLVVRRSLLEELGFQVEVAGNGEEALKLFSAAGFDVVVTDYRMPRMNGAELIVRIREIDPNARIILLSGFVEPLGLSEQNTGANAVIAKSSSEPAHLVRWVKRLLNEPARRKPPGKQTATQRGTPRKNLAH
ncbi:MAG TPA: response regulator [Bryobacteraceae bacterium]|nr:response regulator [Bryobacteraceae bacterium]